MSEDIQNKFEKLIALKSVPLFGELDFDSLILISQITHYQKMSAKETVILEGSPSDKIYIVLSGGVEVLKKNEKIANLVQGDIFGEFGVIDGSVRTSTVKTLSETIFLVVHREDFVNLMKQNGTIAYGVTCTLAQRLRNTLQKIKQTDI